MDSIDARPVLVVIGGGFAGMNLVQSLKGVPLRIVLIDKQNHHTFQPLLYQVATAALSPADIAHPIRHVFRSQDNVSVLLGEVMRVDLKEQYVEGGGERVPFDYLVVACGATHSYFGNDHWEKHAPGLKTINDAIEIRKRMLLAFEEAEYEADEASRRAKLTFVIVGGGPTGVELAGALREIAAKEIPKDFRLIDTTTTRVILIQSGDRVLPGFAPELSARALKDLHGMGVEVLLNSRVTNVDDNGVWIGEKYLPCENAIWAAGVRAQPIAQTLGVPTTRGGQVIVDSDCSVPGHPNVFVIGDAAAIKDSRTGDPVPGLAPAAMQMGRFVAGIIKRDIVNPHTMLGRPAFHYVDKGTMATIGVAKAVADVRGFKFTGVFAWILWGLVHVTFLISFRSKLFVMLGWIYDWVMNGREARLITGDIKLSVQRPRLRDIDFVTALQQAEVDKEKDEADTSDIVEMQANAAD